MTNEQIKEKVKEIEELAYKINLEKASNAALRMSSCDDLCALQLFLQGLSKKLHQENSLAMSIWSKAYGIVNEEEAKNAE